jgi:hypothetical protein
MRLDFRVDDALKEAWDDLSAYLGRRFTGEITAEKWGWPTDPVIRDIVDTGNLRRSLRITQAAEEKSLDTTFEWTAPYAPAVHDGAVFRATDKEGNARTLTARPWTRPVLRDREKIAKYFQMRFALAMRNRREGQP